MVSQIGNDDKNRNKTRDNQKKSGYPGVSYKNDIHIDMNNDGEGNDNNDIDMDEMLEEKEGGKVRLLSVYEKYYEWLMKDEEIPEEKKADKRDTTRYLRNYIKKMKYSISQGRINGKKQ